LCTVLCPQLEGELGHKGVTIQELQDKVQAAQAQAQEASEMMAAMASDHNTEVASLQDKLHTAQAQAQAAEAQAQEAGYKMAAMAEGHTAQMAALQATLVTKEEVMKASMLEVSVCGQWSAALHCPCFICFCLLLTYKLSTCVVRHGASHQANIMARALVCTLLSPGGQPIGRQF
jgi:hypothetical protein